VFSDDTKFARRVAPLLNKVLIVDPNPASARLLTELLRNIGNATVAVADSNARGLVLARQMDPRVIFVELSGDKTDGVAFTRELRRSHLHARKAPVIVVTSTATAAGIMAARDAGVHEFLRKPYVSKDLMRRLDAVLRPRDWIEAVAYVGPDRRRFNSAEYAGPRKRQSDATMSDADRILQALRIIRSAILAMNVDPAQALRALKVQAQELQVRSKSVGDPALGVAAAAFYSYLVDATERGIMDPAEAVTKAGPLLARLPRETPQPERKAG